GSFKYSRGQARRALAERLIGLFQLKRALRNTFFEARLRITQIALGIAPLLDFPGQLLIKLVASGLRLLQVLDQRLILEASDQTALDQPIDLPGDYDQGEQQDQAQPTPTAQRHVTTPEQVNDRRQQARHGKGQECRDARGVSNA